MSGRAEELVEAFEAKRGAAPDTARPPNDDGARLLDELASFVRRYVVLTAHQVVAVALWVLHAHAADAAESTPYLAVTSAERRSGKSRLLELVELLVPRPLLSANVSPAALFRTIAAETPTLLLDEADATFSRNAGERAEELRGLLNAGHRRGAVVIRMVGPGASLKAERFPVFCPKALAGIGELPDTIADRSISIRMKRKSPGEEVTRYRRREVEPASSGLRARLAAWCERRLDGLAEARPMLPDALDDRAADGWEPLLAIADAAGGDWPGDARRAALVLSAGRDDAEADSLGVRLLADVRAVLDERSADRIASAELASALAAMEEAPWGDLYGKALDARGLARRLRPFEVRPRKVRVGEETVQGYRREDFADAWARYCAAFGKDAEEPAAPSPAPYPRPATGTSGTTASPSGFQGVTRPEHDSLGSGYRNGENPHGYGFVPDVPDRGPDEGRGGGSEAPIMRADRGRQVVQVLAEEPGWAAWVERGPEVPPPAPRAPVTDWRDDAPEGFDPEHPFAGSTGRAP